MHIEALKKKLQETPLIQHNSTKIIKFFGKKEDDKVFKGKKKGEFIPSPW